jgi:N-glycosylase/DNA lyase
MTQIVETIQDGRWVQHQLPAPEDEVIPGVRWGRFEALFTPAYWAAQSWMQDIQEQPPLFRLGQTLVEEVAVCLLGGHGITGEVGNAAFHRVRDYGLLSRPASVHEFHCALVEPLDVHGRRIRYRFAQQKAVYLSAAVSTIHGTPMLESLAPMDLRAWLMTLPGIGPKTASWIVRNWHASNDVAILDIHVLRAGNLVGLFPARTQLPRDYLPLESKFIRFAQAIGVGAAKLDALIWMHMRNPPESIRAVLRTTDKRSPDAKKLRVRAEETLDPRIGRRSKQAKVGVESGSHQAELPL